MALPEKPLYRIGEVAELLGVKPHVLRYWECEFEGLRPLKTRGAHRQYRRADVELAVRIHQLLIVEGYSIPGAIRKLQESAGSDLSGEAGPRARGEVSLRATLLEVRRELRAFLDGLGDGVDGPGGLSSSAHEVTVHAATPSSLQRLRSPRSMIR